MLAGCTKVGYGSLWCSTKEYCGTATGSFEYLSFCRTSNAKSKSSARGWSKLYSATSTSFLFMPIILLNYYFYKNCLDWLFKLWSFDQKPSVYLCFRKESSSPQLSLQPLQWIYDLKLTSFCLIFCSSWAQQFM